MSGITVSRRGDRIVAVKEAPSGSERAARLLTEADALQRISHPNVAEYVEHQVDPIVQLVTMFAGTDTWERQPPEGLTAIRALAVVASVLADLHEAKISHGELVPAHIICGPDHHPILCGFGRSTALSPDSKTADLNAIATLLDDLTEDLDDDQRTQIGAISTDLRCDLLSARAATGRLDALLSSEIPATPARQIPKRVFALTAATLGVIAIAVVSTIDNSPALQFSAVSSTTTAPVATTLATTTTLAPPAVGAPTLINQGRRYAIGQPGDVAVVGDWDCDGTDTPALLRPATGEIAVFSDWPAPAAGIAAQHIVVVDGARSLEIDDQDACIVLRVRTANGSVLIPLEST
jgi:hypothetical protein